MSYSVSIVNYYNTVPFLYGLKHCPLTWPHSIELDMPSVCAQKLKTKQVDVGVVPVAILPELNEYHIITDYCIGAVGKVDSVKLFARKPLEELTHILLDYQSKTSITLVQVLNKHFWKKDIQFVSASKGFEEQVEGTTGAVIIGDRTFGLTKYPYQYDLAFEWQKYTELPFVFACWVSNKKLEEEFLHQFNRSLKYGVEHIQQAVIETQNPVLGDSSYDYLQHKISYTFDQEKQKALAKFLALMAS